MCVRCGVCVSARCGGVCVRGVVVVHTRVCVCV